jgi:hypothetical protein
LRIVGRKRYLFLAGFALLLCGFFAHAEEWRFAGVERVVAVSDVHGAFGAMTATLEKAGVLDEDARWSGASTHLVITGDILDRGPDSRRVMDLLMRLENEARDAGGRVHFLLGNHEVMNLVGDLRYVSKAEYAAFADDELAEDRDRWFQAYRAANAGNPDEEALRAEYDEKIPAGFFGLRRAFGSRGAYGPWLMSKPLMIVINDTAYVHGGLSPLVAELGLAGVNGTLKKDVRDYVAKTEMLADYGLLDPTENFFDHPDLLEALPPDAEYPDDIRAAIEDVIRLNNSDVHSPRGPLWYRGSVGCGPLIEEDKLAAALAALGANRVVIGHTPTLTRRVLQRMDGRVIEIDTGMLAAAYKGSGNALIIEGDALTVVGEKAPSNYQPVSHPRRVGYRDDALSADALTQILLNGELTPASGSESEKTILNVTHSGETISAVFERKGRGKGFYPSLAAYRLDRLIGLDMVPVTVAREFDGREGTLQFVPGSMLNEEQRAATGRGGSAWCPLPEQWQAMYVFDALIYNEGRQPANMQYSVDNWQLILSGHDRTFSTGKGLAPYVEAMEAQSGNMIQPGTGWRKALSALTDDSLDEHLGDVLDKRRIRALENRRDELLSR